MSRIGKRPVAIPDGVTVEKKGSLLEVKGPRGKLSAPIPSLIEATVGDGKVSLTRADERKPTRSLHGLARSIVGNMVRGVTDGFAKTLLIEGIGYRAEVSGKKLVLNVGFSHPVEMEIPEGIQVAIARNVEIKVEGIDRQKVGQFAADVRIVRPPEPYKGKGIRYSDERVRRKVGKAGTV